MSYEAENTQIDGAQIDGSLRPLSTTRVNKLSSVILYTNMFLVPILSMK